MSQPDDFSNEDPQAAPLDLTKWRGLPGRCVAVGGVITVLGFFLSWRHDGLVNFAYFWLVAFMLFLGLALGALFLVLAHHLFDAGWSVATRRICEHLAALLFPALAVLFVPILLLAPKIYKWMSANPATDHALKAKLPMFTTPGFYLGAVACFGIWWWLSSRLRYWSVKQDETGAAECTRKMRFLSSVGIFLYAFTVTYAAIMWMKALQYQWFSTMYGVWYFAGSVWLALGTVYVITMLLDRQRVLTKVLHEHQYYFLGSLLFAFTVFYAYVTFAQYFIIWNANMPEETFWYVLREKGTWWWVSMVIIFGHFFVPFLALLRIDVKSIFSLMVPLAVWTWLMRFTDLAFNILPPLFPDNFPILWVWLPLGMIAFMGGVLTKVFLKQFAAVSPFPKKDPRLIEAMGLYHVPVPQISGGNRGSAGQLSGAPSPSKGGH